MTTKTKRTRKVDSTQVTLKRRIRRFYACLNRHDFVACFEMIDPRVRNKPSSVTLLQYQNALTQFLDACGRVVVSKLDLTLHMNEPSKLYEGRDFAVGQTVWNDSAGERHIFSERWVRVGKTWYTRSTGFVVPAAST